MSKKKRIKSPYCTNCGYELTEKDNYCPNCGQENDNKRQSFGHLMSELFLDFIHIDSRIAKSIPALLFRPGFLSKEFVLGRRKKYLDPVRMIITIVVIYFLVSNTKGRLGMNERGQVVADSIPAMDTVIHVGNIPVTVKTDNKEQPIVWYDTSGVSQNNISLDLPKFKELKAMVERGKTDTREILDSLQIENTFWHRFTYGEAVKLVRSDFDDFPDYIISKLPWVIFCSIPVFALLLKLLYVRRKFLYIDHLIFAFHLHSFIFLAALLANLAERVSIPGINFLYAGSLLIYVPLAFRNFYSQNWLKTISKMIALIILYIPSAMLIAIFSLMILFLMY